jgi:hypothetical protein
MTEDAVAVFIPIVAIVMSLSIPIVFAIVDYRRRRDIVEAHHKERMAAIERGMELPPLPEAYFRPMYRRRQSSYLLPGMIWTFVGIALAIFLRGVAGDDVALVGLMPTGVGLALLLYYAIEGRKRRDEKTDSTDQDGLRAPR